MKLTNDQDIAFCKTALTSKRGAMLEFFIYCDLLYLINLRGKKK